MGDAPPDSTVGGEQTSWNVFPTATGANRKRLDLGNHDKLSGITPPLIGKLKDEV